MLDKAAYRVVHAMSSTNQEMKMPNGQNDVICRENGITALWPLSATLETHYLR